MKHSTSDNNPYCGQSWSWKEVVLLRMVRWTGEEEEMSTKWEKSSFGRIPDQHLSQAIPLPKTQLPLNQGSSNIQQTQYTATQQKTTKGALFQKKVSRERGDVDKVEKDPFVRINIYQRLIHSPKIVQKEMREVFCLEKVEMWTKWKKALLATLSTHLADVTNCNFSSVIVIITLDHHHLSSSSSSSQCIITICHHHHLSLS